MLCVHLNNAFAIHRSQSIMLIMAQLVDCHVLLFYWCVYDESFDFMPQLNATDKKY